MSGVVFMLSINIMRQRQQETSRDLIDIKKYSRQHFIHFIHQYSNYGIFGHLFLQSLFLQYVSRLKEVELSDFIFRNVFSRKI